jgi:hypothetical protein
VCRDVAVEWMEQGWLTLWKVANILHLVSVIRVLSEARLDVLFCRVQEQLCMSGNVVKRI